MIVKGRSRGRAAELAAHLLRTDENESIRVHECRGVVAQTVTAALAEMQALGVGVRSRKALYHASISTPKVKPLTDAQVDLAVDALGVRLGLQDQPRIVVIHEKMGRKHVHVVWSRVDLANGKTISDSWNYARHERVARALEREFGHDRVQGAHAERKGKARPKRTPKEYELRQEKRSGIRRADIGAELTALWRSAKTGPEFREAVENAGYVLARGDRRGFVVIDRAGEAHSLARRLGMKSKAVEAKLVDLALERIPSVSDARTALRGKQPIEDGIAFQPSARQGHEDTPAHRHRLASRPGGFGFDRALPPAPEGAASSLRRFRIRREKRKASSREPSTRPRSLFRQQRDALVSIYAAKIAAAHLLAQRHELDAMVQALQAEEQAALAALQESEAVEIAQRRRNRTARQFRLAAHAISRPKTAAPRRRRRVLRRRRPDMPPRG